MLAIHANIYRYIAIHVGVNPGCGGMQRFIQQLSVNMIERVHFCWSGLRCDFTRQDIHVWGGQRVLHIGAQS